MTERDSADNENNNGGKDRVSRRKEPAPTPLISVADVPLQAHPVIHLAENRRKPIELHATEISHSWSGCVEDHVTGKLGEDAFAQFIGTPEQVDLEVRADGGDGGHDLVLDGAKIDVKTVTRRYAGKPRLMVGVHKPLTADYYALVSRIGIADFRLIGYTHRGFVANADTFTSKGKTYHVVDPEYLHPFLYIGKSMGPAS